MAYDKHALYIKTENLEKCAESCAHDIRLTGTVSGRRCAGALRALLKDIASAHDVLALRWDGASGMPQAVRWLLDNHYLLRRECMVALSGLRSVSALPACGGDASVTLMCLCLVRSGRGEVSEERLELFLRGFQKHILLSRQELRSLPDVLRWALAALLKENCDRLVGGEEVPESVMANIFTSLRLLSELDMSSVMERADCVEQLYLGDPAGIYPQMDKSSKQVYRDVTARLASSRKVSEYDAARLVMQLASHGRGDERHIGHWLLDEPLGSRTVKSRGGLYMAGNILITLFLSLLLSFASGSAAVFFLLLLPISQTVSVFTDVFIMQSRSPRPLPRLELKDGIPDEGRTLCAITCLLTDENSARELLRRIEGHRLCSRDCGSNLLFALLADLTSGPDETLLRRVSAGIEALNDQYGGGFFLLTRDPVKNADGELCGWERKRGALDETMRLLRGGESSVRCAAGDDAALTGVRYLLTLDSDTRVTPEGIRMLAGTALHPLNRPRADERRRIVTSGHGIIAPRLATDLASSVRSDLSLIFAGQGGTSGYDCLSSDVYMDCWSRALFTGKGLIDIDAYLFCMKDRIPENTVLSHDTLEGAVLRCGRVSECEFTDAFPANPLSYYKRLHRWVRGDWQNLPWLFRRGKDLPDIERWRIFDKLRRSLVPPATLAAVSAGLLSSGRGMALAAFTALLCAVSDLLLTLGQSLFTQIADSGVRYHSSIFSGIGGGLARAIIRLILLPAEAYFTLDAILRSLWRMLISKKHLLQWQTAMQGDAAGADFSSCLVMLWPCSLFGAFLTVFGAGIMGRAAGIIWIFTPLCAWLLGLPRKKARPLSARDRDYLRTCAGEIWRYFRTFMTEEENFLPPDNFQSRPDVGAAHRTSPTNIGFALLSAAAACDMELESWEKALEMISGCLSTLERLPKYRGQLFNWYDTRTLAPLSPRYVSTVDSGNLCACLIALRSALAEYGEDDLARRADALAGAMDFSMLYDSSRHLFYIGFDADKGEFTPAHYDLLSSEARLTAYLAIAKGDIPKKHWQRLSRAQVQKDRRRGMASWTGTMFEYLMPELLLPLFSDSLLYESARFCLFAQKSRVRSLNVPWGISESAFYSLDPAMNYRYKAHGCAALALKEGMDDELVISPYSSFLALCLDAPGAVKNLRRLEEMSMRGEYGFWEALDRTAGRSLDRSPGIVRCVMSHHLGMSMCAIANCLCSDIFPRRFMADPRMRAYDLLLQEKVPLGSTVIRTRSAPPRRPAREGAPLWELSGQVCGSRPVCCVLANPTYSLLCSENGKTRPLWGAVTPYLSAQLALSLNGELYPLTGAGSWHFSPGKAVYMTEYADFTAETVITVSRDDAAEQRSVTIRAKAPLEGQLMLRFSPLLAAYDDYVNHPAFYKLGLSEKRDRGALTVRRLPRGRTGELFMCLAADAPCRFENVPGADSGRFFAGRPIDEKEYFITEPLTDCLADISLEREEQAHICFSLGMAHSEPDARRAAEDGLSAERITGDLPERAAAVLGMEGADVLRAWAVLQALFSPAPPGGGSHEKSRLWRFGISGDLPIVCADYARSDQLENARALMDIHLLLCACGVGFDLVFITHDGGSYLRPLETALEDVLYRSGGELLSGAKGGVHIIPDGDGADSLRAGAHLAANLDKLPEICPCSASVETAEAVPVRPALPLGSVSLSYNYVNFDFLPPRMWTNILTGSRFGAIAADCGCAGMWFENSRENQIAPWYGHPGDTRGCESLFAVTGPERFSAFASPDGERCRTSFGFGTARWEKSLPGGTLRTCVFIPPDADARVMIIDCLCPGAELEWCLDLLLSNDRRDARYVRTSFADGVLTAENDRAEGRIPPFRAVSDPPFSAFTCDADSADAGSYDGSVGHHARSVFAAKLPAERAVVIVCGCEDADTLRRLARSENAREALRRTEETWRGAASCHLESGCSALDALMGMAVYQTIAGRIVGRCSVYQSGGAYGFRDQLQDTVNMLLIDSGPARAQILRSCLRQYSEGDVQHWWHEAGGRAKGVRTRCSDDLLWLPWALCEYVEKTGDTDICFEQTPFLSSPPLGRDERDRYEEALPGGESADVLTHCRRAMDTVLRRGTGEHGLLRMGSGDWNDGFDRMGGESEWLTWFFCMTVQRFCALLERFSMDSSGYRDALPALLRSANAAWDGQWFLRGFYADGTPLGGKEGSACRIDSIAQSFAAMCPGADADKVTAALGSAVSQLFDRENRLLKLFTPPFDGSTRSPGYISSYGPGFRENGGQYTHGALWLVMALLQNGQVNRAWEILRALLPADRDVLRYKGEPYVIAADVYSAPGHEGEAGWTWYTGSAGWLFRIVTEELLGIRLENGVLRIRPYLPDDIPGFELTVRGHTISVHGGEILFDGRPYNTPFSALGEHIRWE